MPKIHWTAAVPLLFLLSAPARADIVLWTTPGVVLADLPVRLHPTPPGGGAAGHVEAPGLWAPVRFQGDVDLRTVLDGVEPRVEAVPGDEEDAEPWRRTDVWLDGYGWQGFEATVGIEGSGTLRVGACVARPAGDPGPCRQYDLTVGPGSIYLGLEATDGDYGDERLWLVLVEGTSDFRFTNIRRTAYGGVDEGAVPEPGVLVLIGLGVSEVVRRRRPRIGGDPERGRPPTRRAG